MLISLIPLLTIALPTYNRADLLDGALGRLLPQIDENKNDIEFVISDNASTDNTQEVVKKYIREYPGINFISNLQPHNTGYFGNFKKCKELSQGKYFWLLSDNEHVAYGVVSFLIKTINSTNNQVGAYYFENTIPVSKIKLDVDYETFTTIQTNFSNLVKNETAWKLTSISSVVFVNDKRYDSESLLKLNENLFLGFIFLCNAMRINDKISIINGNIYISVPCKVYFDIFKAWTIDIIECVNYMTNSGLLTEYQKLQFVSSFLKANVREHVYLYKLQGSINGKSYGTIKELKNQLDSFYNDNPYYKAHITPLFLRKKWVLVATHFIKRVRRKLDKVYSEKIE